MYIAPVKCPGCGRTGRPAEVGFRAAFEVGGVVIQCDCGQSISLRGEEARDQQILSANTFSRLSAASNHFESGTVRIQPGHASEIRFTRPFDFPCKAFLTPNAPVALRADFLAGDKVRVLSSILPSHTSLPEVVEIDWSVYGLVGIDSLPTWYVHFYAALTQLENGFFKPALLDYAVAFEVFLETFLTERLSQRFSPDASSYLLRRTPRVEERAKELLELAIGCNLTSRDDVYQPWDRDVRKPRNQLAHGDRLVIDRDAALRAHSAAYQAIRWIQGQAG